jgi:hypothetical protein
MNLSHANFLRHLTCGVALLLAACASQEREISPQATSALTQVRTQAVQLKQDLGRTNESAKTLSKSEGPELSSSLSSLSGNLDTLNSRLGMGREAVKSAQDQVAAYFANWDKQTRGMSEEMQKTSQERQTEAAASFDSLRASIGAVRSDLSPYVSDMGEIVEYLRTDQTSAGLDAVSPRLSDAIDREPTIQQDLDNVIAEIDAIQNVKQ